jgi:hypothetical protein
MLKKRLFEIIDFVLKDDNIIVQIVDNNYTDNSIVVPVDQFKAYLDRHDKLYFEANDYSTGQLLTKSYILTFENYWEETEREYREDDLYDFIVVTCFDFTKAIDNIILRQKLTHYLW